MQKFVHLLLLLLVNFSLGSDEVFWLISWNAIGPTYLGCNQNIPLLRHCKVSKPVCTSKGGPCLTVHQHQLSLSSSWPSSLSRSWWYWSENGIKNLLKVPQRIIYSTPTAPLPIGPYNQAVQLDNVYSYHHHHPNPDCDDHHDLLRRWFTCRVKLVLVQSLDSW